MNGILIILLAVAMVVVVLIMFAGIVAFVKGGDFHQKYGNRLMQMRVAAQAAAVFLVLLLVLSRTGGN